MASSTPPAMCLQERLGKGSIIYMVDNPMFRSFWENGKLLLVNAIFYVNNSKVRI